MRIRTIEKVEKFFERLLSMCLGFQPTLPYNNDSPPEFAECFYIALVSDTVPVYLGPPKFSIGFRQPIIFAVFVTMPKASVNKNHSLKTAHYDVR